MKHNNYEPTERIILTKTRYCEEGKDDTEFYLMTYESEGYEFFGTRDEVLDELREHMDLMRGK